MMTTKRSIIMIVSVCSLMVQPMMAWTSSGTTTTTTSLGKKSTALNVLDELNRSKQLAPWVTKKEMDENNKNKNKNNNNSKNNINNDNVVGTAGVAVVTGGNAGIGAVSCKTLALAGMQVVMCTRKTRAAEELIQTWPLHVQNRITVQELDLANLQSVETAAKSIMDKFPTIDVLLNNAGVMAPPSKMLTKDGLELQFGTNHVGHYFLTRLLLPALKNKNDINNEKKKNPKSRVVTVASTAHRMVNNAKNLEWESSDYSGWREYGRSKLENVLFAKHLNELVYEQHGIESVCLHPGVIGTNLWQYFPRFLQPLTGLFADKTVEQGAATSVYCCLAHHVLSGAYYDDCQVGQATAIAQDKTLAKDLWEYTENLLSAKGFVVPPLSTTTPAPNTNDADVALAQ